MEQDGDMKEEERGKRGKAVRESVSFILYLIVIVVLTFLMIRYVGQRTQSGWLVHGKYPYQWR